MIMENIAGGFACWAAVAVLGAAGCGGPDDAGGGGDPVSPSVAACGTTTWVPDIWFDGETFYDENAECVCTEWFEGFQEVCNGIEIQEHLPLDNPLSASGWGGATGEHMPQIDSPWGLVFLGLSFSQNRPDVRTANRASVTHQTRFDLEQFQDRTGTYLSKTNDDGWLGGGGQSPRGFMLPNIDSTHAEIAHFRSSLCSSGGGVSVRRVVEIAETTVFEPLKVTITGGKITGSWEFQLRLNPIDAEGKAANVELTALYEGLINVLSEQGVKSLDKTDPFHISMCRETKFYNVEAFKNFSSSVQSHIEALPEQAIINDGVARYNVDPTYLDTTLPHAGGYYLFLTRNRPLLYFSPNKNEDGGAAHPSVFYAKWIQDGVEVIVANPHALIRPEVEERLERVGEGSEGDISLDELIAILDERFCN
jgi:hypothetical protein